MRCVFMRTLRSIWWVLVLAPLLFFVAGCENNEKGVDFKGTTTSPQAATSIEDSLKRGAEPAKPTAPTNYPGAGRRK
jgi:hypothetical protein